MNVQVVSKNNSSGKVRVFDVNLLKSIGGQQVERFSNVCSYMCKCFRKRDPGTSKNAVSHEFFAYLLECIVEILAVHRPIQCGVGWFSDFKNFIFKGPKTKHEIFKHSHANFYFDINKAIEEIHVTQ